MNIIDYASGQVSDINSIEFSVASASSSATIFGPLGITSGSTVPKFGNKIKAVTVTQANGAVSNSLNNELAISGEWVYCDPNSGTSLQVSLLSGGGTSTRHAITLNPGDMIKATFSSIRILGASFGGSAALPATFVANCRLIYGTGDVTFMPVVNNQGWGGSSPFNNIIGYGCVSGNIVGGQALQILQSSAALAHDGYLIGGIPIRTPVAGCYVDVIVGGGSITAPLTPGAAIGVQGYTQEIVSSNYFANQGDYMMPINARVNAGLFLYVAFRTAAATLATVQAIADFQFLSARSV